MQSSPGNIYMQLIFSFFFLPKELELFLWALYGFCVCVLPPSMVFCYTIVSRWTCWNALSKSVTAPCVSAREISEMQELLLSYQWSEQSSTATVHPLRAGCGEHRAWAAGLPWAMQNNSGVLLLMGWTAAVGDQKRECSPRWGMLRRIL